MQPAILGSWKEIAQYLGKGVRTVQRWERELHLPVHRPSGARKGVVIAFPEELQNWAKKQAGSESPEIRFEQIEQMRKSYALLVERTHKLRENLQRIQEGCLKAQAWVSKTKKGAARNQSGAAALMPRVATPPRMTVVAGRLPERAPRYHSLQFTPAHGGCELHNIR
ncbi:MAG TPA: hypothetical protein VE998_09980 [Terriglobales bacterium]|nr:hypothetical protein [Terriglobales bacterium]